MYSQDHAGHANDPTGHLHEILEFNRAMDAMRGWIDDHGDSETVLISTADHECGGLTLGYELSGDPSYWFAPQYFADSKGTSGTYAALWKAYKSGNNSDSTEYLKKSIFAPYGILNPTDAEIAKGVELKASSGDFGRHLGLTLSKRLGVNWATGGHSGVDVTLYGYGQNHEQLAGHRENTEIADFVLEQLGLSLTGVTKKLKSNRTFVDGIVKRQPGDPAKMKSRELTHHHH